MSEPWSDCQISRRQPVPGPVRQGLDDNPEHAHSTNADRWQPARRDGAVDLATRQPERTRNIARAQQEFFSVFHDGLEIGAFNIRRQADRA